MKKAIIIPIIIILMIPTASAAYSKYDVNQDGIVESFDAKQTWNNIGGSDLSTYDVNDDSIIDAFDAKEVWAHIGDTGEETGNVIIDWLSDIIYG